MNRVAVALTLAALGMLPVWVGPQSARATAPTTVVVWAWHGARHLDSLDPRRFEVAYLARTLTIEPSGVRVERRRSPLYVAPAIRLTSVVRIERAAGLSSERAQTSLDQLSEVVLGALRPESVRLQIDFDAPQSFRPFYRALLRRIRARLPPGIELSMTALASWCTGDRWLADLPVDEIVPMLFAMGRGGAPVHDEIRRAATLPEPRCRSSMGVSLHERLPRWPAPDRLYLWGVGTRTSGDQILRFLEAPWATLPP